KVSYGSAAPRAQKSRALTQPPGPHSEGVFSQNLDGSSSASDVLVWMITARSGAPLSLIRHRLVVPAGRLPILQGRLADQPSGPMSGHPPLSHCCTVAAGESASW